MKKVKKKFGINKKGCIFASETTKNTIICEIGILNTAMPKRLKKLVTANIANSTRWQNTIIAL